MPTASSNASRHLLLSCICVSLLVNVALVWRLSRSPAKTSSAAAIQTSDATQSLPMTATNPTAAENPAIAEVTAPPTPSFHWNTVESADYRQYVANLRSIGCPEEMIRDIVGADLAQANAARVREIWSPTPYEYWQKPTNQQPSAEQMKQLYALSRDQAEPFTELFGARPSQQDTIDVLLLQLHGDRQQLLFLPEAQRDAALQALREGSSEEDAALRDGHSMGDQKADFKKKLEALAAVLSPAELEEYEVRNSPTAGMLKSELRFFDCTAEEFKRLMDAREKSSSRISGDPFNRTAAVQQARELFGEERAMEFERVTDILYANARQGAEANGIPIERADEAWMVTREAKVAAEKIAKNSTLPVADRKAQLDALRDLTATQLKQTLGDAASRQVTRDMNVFFQVTGNLRQ